MNQTERKHDPFLIWTAAGVGVSLILSLPFFDTVLRFSMMELLMDGDYQRIAAAIIAVSFGLELLLLRAKKWRLLKWSAVVFPVICLIVGEVFWLMGGWDQIAGLILWWFGFPMLMGAGLAVFLTNLPRSRRVQTVLVILLVVWLIFCALFWPRALGEHLRLEIQEPMLILYPDGTSEWRTVRNTDTVEQMLHYAEVIPAVFDPDWREERRVLLRLNGEYIVAAEHGQAPCIYFYSGALEEFDGGGAKWRLFHFPALYTELIEWGEEITRESAEN